MNLISLNIKKSTLLAMARQEVFINNMHISQCYE